MELVLILGLFLIGFLLVIVEFFFIPGNTVIGVLGILIITFGIFQVYNYYDAATGSIVLGIVLFLFLGGVIYAAKTRAWEKYSNKDMISSRVLSMEKEGEVKAGDTGEAVSTIRPLGKAIINKKAYEVRSLGELIPTGSKLKVVKISNGKIYVEPVEPPDQKQSKSKPPEDEADL